MLRSGLAYSALVFLYGQAWLAAVVGRAVPRRKWKPTGRIAVTGTFHNPNWYLSHLTPLSLSGPKEVILVVDEPQLPLSGVRFVCPPRWVAGVFSRAIAKAAWLVGAGLRYRPDLYMGYHLMPGGCSALVAGRLLGRPTCYQMTGGPIEVIGGGAQKDGPLTGSLRHPSAFLERLAMSVVRQFDLIVVRGSKAERFLRERNVRGQVAVITGSIKPRSDLNSPDRDIDLIYVGRLDRMKQPWQFVEIVAKVRRSIPGVRAVIVGDGPMLKHLQRQAAEIGAAGNIEFLGKRSDVEAILSRAKVFLLTSRSEGLSIAMAEAMAAGVVPVVANVGELADLVQHEVSGYLVTPNDLDGYAVRSALLLTDASMWARCSTAAIKAPHRYCSLIAVTELWRQRLGEVIGRCARVSGTEVSN